jgi:hypothetical protein
METINPGTLDGMREATLRSIEFCRMQLEMFGKFEQHFALVIGDDTAEFTLSPRAAASSLTRIFEEAHTEAARRRADIVFLMLNRAIASMNQQREVEHWELIFVVTQTRHLTVLGMLPFHRTKSGAVFDELQTGQSETDSLGMPQDIFEKLGYVVDEGALSAIRKGRGREAMWD